MAARERVSSVCVLLTFDHRLNRLKDRFGGSGATSELIKEFEVSAQHIAHKAAELVGIKKNHQPISKSIASWRTATGSSEHRFASAVATWPGRDSLSHQTDPELHRRHSAIAPARLLEYTVRSSTERGSPGSRRPTEASRENDDQATTGVRHL